jgi:phospholipid/cholesterol/gamma-HCH transport system permease protein
MKVFLGQIGQSTALVMAGISRLCKLFSDVLRYTFKGSVRTKALFEQMALAGVDSLVIICLVGGAVGMVLALQSAYQLKDIGMEMYTGSLVAVSVTRELGPLMAAIIISGRIGARMAAELGTMKVQEEIDALVTMGLNPVRFLVVPRCLSLFIMLPCLTVITMWMAMFGGFIIGTVGVGINPDIYIAKSFDALVMKDVYSGLFKSCVFAVLVALISCHQGLSVEGGADGVGKATTQAVVTSIVLIIVFDALTTAILYYALPA